MQDIYKSKQSQWFISGPNPNQIEFSRQRYAFGSEYKPRRCIDDPALHCQEKELDISVLCTPELGGSGRGSSSAKRWADSPNSIDDSTHNRWLGGKCPSNSSLRCTFAPLTTPYTSTKHYDRAISVRPKIHTEAPKRTVCIDNSVCDHETRILQLKCES